MRTALTVILVSLVALVALVACEPVDAEPTRPPAPTPISRPVVSASTPTPTVEVTGEDLDRICGRVVEVMIEMEAQNFTMDEMVLAFADDMDKPPSFVREMFGICHEYITETYLSP